MNNINDVVEHLFPGITEDVNEFLKDTKYIDSTFGDFKRFEMSPHGKKFLYVVPKGLDSEDLNEFSPNFDFALSELGRKYGLRLSLPYWAFEK